MKEALAVVTTAVLVMATAAAAATTGTWNTTDDGLLSGTWVEAFGAGGPGQPGCVLSALDQDGRAEGTQWSLGELYIPVDGGPEVTWDGTVATYTTDYTTDLDASGGQPAFLELLEAPGLWGEGVLFEYVEATVTARVDYGYEPPLYLDGQIVGLGTAEGMLVEFYGEVSETGGDATGHWGTVDYVELSLAELPKPAPGAWTSLDDPLATGEWTETYGAGGPGQPGCVLAAADSDGAQWSLGHLYIPADGGAEVTWDGTVATYTTAYTTDLAASGGQPAFLELLEVPELWGDGWKFEYVEATVTARVDYGYEPPLYVGGEIVGSGAGAGLAVDFYGEVDETGGDAAGHWGTVDYLEVTVLPEAAVLPDGYTIVRGQYLEGGLGELAFSDDVRLEVRVGITLTSSEPPVWLVIDGTSPTEAPEELRFTFEGFATAAGLTQRVELYDFATEQWEELHAGTSAVADTVVEVVAEGDLSRFVEAGTGVVRAQLTWKPDGPITVFPWEVGLDQAIWTIK